MKKTRTTFEQNLKQLNKTCNNMIRMFICSEAVTTDSQFLHVGFRVQRVQIRRISVFLAVLTYIKDQLILNLFVWTLSLSLSLPLPLAYRFPDVQADLVGVTELSSGRLVQFQLSLGRGTLLCLSNMFSGQGLI